MDGKIVFIANENYLLYTEKTSLDRGAKLERKSAYSRRFLRSRYTEAASAEKATMAMLLNSGTGMLDCCMYTLPAVPTSPPVTAILNVCEAIPGLAIVSEYEPGVRYIPYRPSYV